MPVTDKVYSASDYAGLSVGDRQFYYGYEERTSDADDAEWCFVYRRAGREYIRIPASQLTNRPGDRWECERMLLLGIAHWLELSS